MIPVISPHRGDISHCDRNKLIMKDITIIGAGLSGTLLAMKLFGRRPAQPVHIRMIDRAGEDNLGPAYSTDEDHLLNVPAEIMGV